MLKLIHKDYNNMIWQKGYTETHNWICKYVIWRVQPALFKIPGTIASPIEKADENDISS